MRTQLELQVFTRHGLFWLQGRPSCVAWSSPILRDLDQHIAACWCGEYIEGL